MAANDETIRYVSFSRNFGKEAALLAGLRKSRGELVATMDVDLQDPPALLPEMLRLIKEEDYDCVATCRSSREGEPPVRLWFARRFYWLMRHFSDVALVDGARDYRLMTRQVVDAVLDLPERNRFTKGIYQWVGFRTKWLSFPNVERQAGRTKWSFQKLFLYRLEGILAFSTAPLQIASLLGIASCLLAFGMLLFVFLSALLFGDPVSGWPSLICVIVFVGGLQLFVVGIHALTSPKPTSKPNPVHSTSSRRKHDEGLVGEVFNLTDGVATCFSASGGVLRVRVLDELYVGYNFPRASFHFGVRSQCSFSSS